MPKIRLLKKLFLDEFLNRLLITSLMASPRDQEQQTSQTLQLHTFPPCYLTTYNLVFTTKKNTFAKIIWKLNRVGLRFPAPLSNFFLNISTDRREVIDPFDV